MKIIWFILNCAQQTKLQFFVEYALLQQFFIERPKRNAYWIHNQKKTIYLVEYENHWYYNDFPYVKSWSGKIFPSIQAMWNFR